MNSILIEIKDDGVGIENEKIERIFSESEYIEKQEKEHSHIGLKNIDERIKLYYGNKFGIRLESVKGEYTKVIINIPIIE